MTQHGPCAPHLEMLEVRKAFGGQVALDGASLKAAPGEVHALLGENGAGKSTLIRILSGVLRPDSGSIRLAGRELRLTGPAATRREGIHAAFQDLSLIPDLTVAENLFFPREPLDPIARVNRRGVRREALRMLERAGIPDLDPDLKLGRLPLWTRQKLEIVKAISGQPRVLILDEPTSALSMTDSTWVLSQAREAARAGAVVIFVSHRLAEVREVADRITVLRSGRRVAKGTPSTMSDDEIIAAMLGRSLGRLYPERTQTPGAVVLTAKGLAVPGKLGPIDLDVRKGEIFGVAALQGQGQRELLMALGGAAAWQGDVRVDGKAFTARSPAQALRSGVALVPEDRQREGLFLAHPVRFNISISVLHRLRGWLFSVDARKELSTARDEAERLGLPAARLEHPAGALSGGNQQKAVFCKVLLTGPRILILHDCTRGVDVGTKAEIFRVVSDLTARGTAVIFYSSDLSELVNMCDRIAVLSEGKIRGVLARGEASEEMILRLAMGSPARAAEAQPVM